MKRIPHSRKATGYFGSLDVEALVREIQKVIESPDEYFSFTDEQRGKSYIFQLFRVATEEEVLRFDRAEASDFFGRLRMGEWIDAFIDLVPDHLTPSLKPLMSPSDVDEYIHVAIYKPDGILEIGCRLQSVRTSLQFINDVGAARKAVRKTGQAFTLYTRRTGNKAAVRRHACV